MKRILVIAALLLASGSMMSSCRKVYVPDISDAIYDLVQKLEPTSIPMADGYGAGRIYQTKGMTLYLTFCLYSL